MLALNPGPCGGGEPTAVKVMTGPFGTGAQPTMEHGWITLIGRSTPAMAAQRPSTVIAGIKPGRVPPHKSVSRSMKIRHPRESLMTRLIKNMRSTIGVRKRPPLTKSQEKTGRCHAQLVLTPVQAGPIQLPTRPGLLHTPGVLLQITPSRPTRPWGQPGQAPKIRPW